MSNIKSDIAKIIEAGVLAPSGENAQQWRFVVDRDYITLINRQERDRSLYNHKQRASYIAHGAVLENMAQMARSLGYGLDIELFPNGKDHDFVAKAKVSAGQGESAEDLSAQIAERVTNRKPYDNVVLEKEKVDGVEGVSTDAVKVGLVTKGKEMNRIADATNINERIAFENEDLHGFLFDHVTWSEDEDLEKKIGFYIKTFDLPAPAEKMFKLAKSWKTLSLINKFGFSKLIGKANAQIHRKSSAMGIITSSDDSPEGYIDVGRIFERTWLKATELGLSFQPIAGHLFLSKRIMDGDKGFLEKRHTEELFSTYNLIKDLYNVPSNESVFMMFRVGYSVGPSARSLRFEAEIDRY